MAPGVHDNFSLRHMAAGFKDTGCLVSINYSELIKGGLDITTSFCDACQSVEFLKSCVGFSNVQFSPNVHLMEAFNMGRQKFASSIESDSTKLENSGAYLGVVFHGTSPHNIDSILKNGLDQNRRSGQAYGPGEYFSKRPDLSVSYCKGGLEMLVFVVVLPQTTSGFKCPADMVVVNNSGYQLPIGVITFESVARGVARTSATRRINYFSACMKEVDRKGKIKRDAKIRSEIIQHLIADRIDTAAGIYEKTYLFLNKVSRREISWYVHRNLPDENIRCGYFSNLLDPMELDETEGAKIQSLEDATEQEQDAMKQLQAAGPFVAPNYMMTPSSQLVHTNNDAYASLINSAQGSALSGDNKMSTISDIKPPRNRDEDQAYLAQAIRNSLNENPGQSDNHSLPSPEQIKSQLVHTDNDAYASFSNGAQGSALSGDNKMSTISDTKPPRNRDEDQAYLAEAIRNSLNENPDQSDNHSLPPPEQNNLLVNMVSNKRGEWTKAGNTVENVLGDDKNLNPMKSDEMEGAKCCSLDDGTEQEQKIRKQLRLKYFDAPINVQIPSSMSAFTKGTLKPSVVVPQTGSLVGSSCGSTSMVGPWQPTICRAPSNKLESFDGFQKYSAVRNAGRYDTGDVWEKRKFDGLVSVAASVLPTGRNNVVSCLNKHRVQNLQHDNKRFRIDLKETELKESVSGNTYINCQDH